MKANLRCLTFAWIILLYGLAVSYFLNGFLLTRREIHLKASNESLFLMHRKYNQVVILIIDALKYDFIKYNNGRDLKSLSPFENKLPFIHNLLSNNHAEIYKFIADPPTTTMQRLKGLTTGSLPTFIDVGSNFASDELMEDNIIHQMNDAHKNLTFMGDDTWMGLFPRSFQPSFPFPSFDVWDIDTVDEGVTKHLNRELQKNGWNLLIAHCLGVDHVGHRFGPHHPVMTEKLLQMNNLIKLITQKMNKETLLIVMGDHGMTNNGDHGGDSSDETSAGLFVYSPMLDLKHNASVPKVVNQIDLVPTLALLMGVPIPYSNLGMVILDLIQPERPTNGNAETNEETQHLTTLAAHARALFANVNQIWHYLESYHSETPITSKEFHELGDEFLKLKNHFISKLDIKKCHEGCQSVHLCCPRKDELEKFIASSKDFLSGAREMCRSMWARFDLAAITTGLAVFLITIIIHLTHVFDPAISYPSVRTLLFITALCFILRLLSDSLAIGTLALITLYFFKHVTWKCWVPTRFNLSVLLPAVMALSYTSNSFVVEEPYVSHFLVQTLIWGPLVRAPWTFNELLDRCALSVSSRLGLHYFRCREEQSPYCEANSFHRSLSSLATLNWVVSFRVICAVSTFLFIAFVISTRFRVPKPIIRLLTLIPVYWIAQLAFVALGIQDRILKVLPWSFYLYFLYTLASQLIFILRPNLEANTSDVNVNILLLFWALSLLLGGDGLGPGIVSILANIFLFRTLFTKEKTVSAQVLYGFLSMHGFFATGHHTSLPNIPWETAFVGFSHASAPSIISNLLPAFLVSFSTASSLFLHAFAVPLALGTGGKKKPQSPIDTWRKFLTFLLFHAVQLFGCMLAAAIHRRHLMVWKIFAPRLLYQLVLTVYATLGLALSIAVNHKTNT